MLKPVHFSRLAAAGLVVLWLCAAASFGQPQPQPQPQPQTAAQAKAENPLTFEAAYTADAVHVIQGLESGSALLSNLDLTLSADLEALWGWKSTSFFAYGLADWGGSVSDRLGEAQTFSNIEAPAAARVYEMFVEHRFLEDRVSVLGGLYDLNSEFDVIEAASLFVNSSFGIGAEYSGSREQGPSIFPFTSLGARIRLVPHRHWMLQFAALDGVPGHPDNPQSGPFHFDRNDGLLLAGEISFFSNEPHGRPAARPGASLRHRARVSRFESLPFHGKVSVGGWHYTAEFDPLDGGTPRRGNQGAYALVEWRVHDSGDDGGLYLFARAGVANPELNEVGAYTGAGLVYAGIGPSRPDDQIGLAVATAHFSDAQNRFRRQASGAEASAERVLELTYSARAADWLTLQLDLQHIRHPSGQQDRKDALAAALRLQITR